MILWWIWSGQCQILRSRHVYILVIQLAVPLWTVNTYRNLDMSSLFSWFIDMRQKENQGDWHPHETLHRELDLDCSVPKVVQANVVRFLLLISFLSSWNARPCSWHRASAPRTSCGARRGVLPMASTTFSLATRWPHLSLVLLSRVCWCSFSCRIPMASILIDKQRLWLSGLYSEIWFLPHKFITAFVNSLQRYSGYWQVLLTLMLCK